MCDWKPVASVCNAVMKVVIQYFSATSVLKLQTEWAYVLKLLILQTPGHIVSPCGYIWFSSHPSHSFIWYFYRLGVTPSHPFLPETAWSRLDLISQVNQRSTFAFFASIILYTRGRLLFLENVCCCFEFVPPLWEYHSFQSEWFLWAAVVTWQEMAFFFGQCSSPNWSYIRCLGRVQTFRVSWHSHILLVKCWITLSEMSMF